jgi:hypothetical protein
MRWARCGGPDAVGPDAVGPDAVGPMRWGPMRWGRTQNPRHSKDLPHLETRVDYVVPTVDLTRN